MVGMHIANNNNVTKNPKKIILKIYLKKMIEAETTDQEFDNKNKRGQRKIKRFRGDSKET